MSWSCPTVFRRLLTGVACVTLCAAATPTVQADDAANWIGYGRTPAEQRYSPLDQIDRRNVAKLGLDWSLDMPDAVSFTSTPLAIDGVLYFSGDRAIVRAVDARTGRLLWRHDPESWKHSPRSVVYGFNTSRGIAHWQGKIYVGAIDGRLIALDAGSGRELWSTRTFPAGERRANTGAPRAFDGKIFIGHGGAEFRTRGYVDAYDAMSGERLWRFHTVPGNPADGFENPAMQMAAKTWHGEWWKVGGGGTVWNAISYDPELDVVYIGVGNGDPWDRELRSAGQGDNLFLCSIVALRADTGEYVWRYQTTPGEQWDYKSTMDIVLADLVIDGRPRKVLMQAPTNGFYYVLDRATGELLSAEKYEKVTWAERIDLRTGRPVEAPGFRYDEGRKVEIWPGAWGAHNWQAMSFSPKTGLAYIPTMHMPATYSKAPGWQFRDGFFVIGLNIEHPLDPAATSGGLLAWDPVQQQARWRVDYDAVWNGGTLVTAGDVVFHGTADGTFAAYDARDGRSLWQFDAQRGISSAPISYAVDGRQHVALLVGSGGLGAFGVAAFQKHPWTYKGPGIRLLSFSLSGRAKLPAVQNARLVPVPVDTGNEPLDETLVAEGLGIYHGSSCATCHGLQAVANGMAAPDLRFAPATGDFRAFDAIVADGALLPNGMPRFADLTDRELRAVFEYLRSRARSAAFSGSGAGPAATTH